MKKTRSKRIVYFDRRKLLELRYEKGISQVKLALLTGIDRSTLSRIENGVLPSPCFGTIAKLAIFFEVPIEHFKNNEFNFI